MILIGIGNPYRGDDAAGRIVARRLRERPPAGTTVREAAGDLSCLLDLWEGEETVLLVDTVRSGRPVGTIVRHELGEEPLPATLSPMSTHALGLREAIELARTLDRLPGRLVILGIEGARFGLGEPLSAEVEAACDQVTAEVSEWTNARGLSLELTGRVQGVGFRPFVYRLASELDLRGWVANDPSGLRLLVEGPDDSLRIFLERVRADAPEAARIEGGHHSFRELAGHERFTIETSRTDRRPIAILSPDLATCEECLREILDPRERRYRYPFTNCTRCGPRYTIVESLPYDRERTSMKGFPLCDRCRREFEDPRDRRFHAQPIACPDCGPRLSLRDGKGAPLGAGDAIAATAEAIRAGAIVAVKGIGGFHLLVDARDEDAVRRLRKRKPREEKPFALLHPTLEQVARDAVVSPLERKLLTSPEAPIVLLRRTGSALAPSVAPESPWFGILLPSNPLHHLLLEELGFPVVATSGNRSDETIVIDNDDAFERLAGVADHFLVHDRPIVRPVDDSIVRVIAGRPVVLRCARGYAPLSISLDRTAPPALAVGGHLKGAVAIGTGGRAVLGQHLGDLGAEIPFDGFRRSLDDLRRLHDLEPSAVACDAHPDYPSTRHAGTLGCPVTSVQHHHAHVLSCVAESGLDLPVLGVVLDGTGYGTDGTIWGGEFLHVTGSEFTRRAHLRRFRLPGGERAIREPRRSALGVLFELFGEDLPGDVASIRTFSPAELRTLLSVLASEHASPVTSSAGRLFDAVASLLDLCQVTTYEGQAAVAVEAAALGGEGEGAYDTDAEDWGGLVHGILRDLRKGVARERIAARFHATLVETIVAVAARVGEERVALTGGCFQNGVLTERAVRRLREAGHRPCWHRDVPPNDGGLAVGQLLAVARR